MIQCTHSYTERKRERERSYKRKRQAIRNEIENGALSSMIRNYILGFVERNVHLIKEVRYLTKIYGTSF